MYVDPVLAGVLLIVAVLGVGGAVWATKRIVRASHIAWVSRACAVVGALFLWGASLPFAAYADYLGTTWGSPYGSSAVMLGAAIAMGIVFAVFIVAGALIGSVIGLGAGVAIGKLQRRPTGSA